MAADHIPATLSFLTDAGHLLALASPETSAYLMSQRNAFMFNTDLDQPDVQRQHVCGCCGHIMIFGHGDEFRMTSGKTIRKPVSSCRTAKAKAKANAKAASPGSGCRKILTCNKCGRYTKIGLPAPARIPKRRFKKTLRTTLGPPNRIMAGGSADSPPQPPPPPPPPASRYPSALIATPSSNDAAKASANASSKKRAKNRKQGLQALLQQSNSKAQAGLGLSLADFMQN
ncbi:putative RNAse P Rpr2 Rpp21 SNM1 subunit domain-containing protein [Rosellinia necatrix]|uniref:Putative RNAse P Rpr2 Rpp21 SNM1 subunit domain-containing protein n=1 Tax=Rosellinia necatrix TaxID=77044 RepID=A0A1S7ULI2_ROSNE|nr:putative RNAse P Rpr2 Rpp21 SNM1 subunit domain-containing protein [Rosellinia necatrix]